MTNPIIRIHNTETDEIIDRQMTSAEFENYKAIQANNLIFKTQAEANATAKAALLERLGITADEAALLLS